MRFLDAEFVQGFIRMADDGWKQGWHERNGGNLSYRVKEEEVKSVKENFGQGEWKPYCVGAYRWRKANFRTSLPFDEP